MLCYAMLCLRTVVFQNKLTNGFYTLTQFNNHNSSYTSRSYNMHAHIALDDINETLTQFSLSGP